MLGHVTTTVWGPCYTAFKAGNTCLVCGANMRPTLHSFTCLVCGANVAISHVCHLKTIISSFQTLAQYFHA